MRLHTRLEEFGVPVQPRAKLNVTHKSEMRCDRARKIYVIVHPYTRKVKWKFLYLHGLVPLICWHTVECMKLSWNEDPSWFKWRVCGILRRFKFLSNLKLHLLEVLFLKFPFPFIFSHASWKIGKYNEVSCLSPAKSFDCKFDASELSGSGVNFSASAFKDLPKGRSCRRGIFM